MMSDWIGKPPHPIDPTVKRINIKIFLCPVCGIAMMFKGKDYCACDGVEYYEALKYARRTLPVEGEDQ